MDYDYDAGYFSIKIGKQNNVLISLDIYDCSPNVFLIVIEEKDNEGYLNSRIEYAYIVALDVYTSDFDYIYPVIKDPTDIEKYYLTDIDKEGYKIVIKKDFEGLKSEYHDEIMKFISDIKLNIIAELLLD